MKISGKWKLSFSIIYTLVFALLILACVRCVSTDDCTIPPTWHLLACVVFLGLTLVKFILSFFKPKNVLLQDNGKSARSLFILHFLILTIATLSLLHDYFLPRRFVEWYRIFAILILLTGSIIQLITSRIIFEKGTDVKSGVNALQILSLLKFGGAVWVDGFYFGLPLAFLLSYGGVPKEQLISIVPSVILFVSFMLLLILNVVFEYKLLNKIKNSYKKQ